MVANTSAGSVITAPALMKTSPVVANAANVHSATSAPARSAASRYTSAPQPAISSNDGRRAANSFTPKTAIAAADSQVDSGGLPQNGTP